MPCAPLTPEPTAQAEGHVYEVVVVGAGFAGVGAAIALKQMGADFRVLEKASEIGGVWRDNTYPDCGCDVPAALYSYSFAANPRWSRLFAKQAEIKAYTFDTARQFQVLDHIQLNTAMQEARWDAATGCWHLETNRGLLRARFVVMACGPMHVPTQPAIPGSETFTGKQFHSSQWDHGCELTGQRVAVIGSGASAIQFVPEIAKQVAHLTLFQRTAPWVLPKMDAPISAAWQQRFARWPWLQALLRKALYLQFEVLNSGLRYPFFVQRLQRAGLNNIARSVKDPELRKQLTPNFALGCKRILQSNTWYRALAQPHTTVRSGVREIQGRRIIDSEGHSAEVDVLIFATGFEVANPPIAQHIVGASGQRLADLWQGSPQAYLGTMVPDCPNLFLTLGPNLYTFSSAFVMIEAQLQFIRAALTTARRENLATIAVNPRQLAHYNRQVQSALQRTVWNSGCASYFLDRHGRNSTNWPWTTLYMRWRLKRFRMAEFDVTRRLTPESH